MWQYIDAGFWGVPLIQYISLFTDRPISPNSEFRSLF